MTNPGIFIVSLDFELNWGVHDVFSPEEYNENLLGVREAIPRMLELFKRHDIHATWATVGMLLSDCKENLLNSFPTIKPSYLNPAFSPYSKLDKIGENEEEDPFHFGLSLLKQVSEYRFQEIGTHTFSHYYCLEEGQTIKEFEADLIAALNMGNANGYHLKSLIFPRNQTNEKYLQVCKQYGIQCFRGNETSWIYRASSFHNRNPIRRVVRLLDCYINISGHHTYVPQELEINPLVNLPSSRFLRAYSSRLKWLESLRLNRIKKSLSVAAKQGEVFHLWWHPHNFGKNIDENIQFLARILEHVAKLKEKYHFQSLNMEEASKFVLGLENNGDREVTETALMMDHM